MKKWLPVLVCFAGLGSSFFFGQPSNQSDPFHRYLTGLKTGKPEGDLVRFAAECGVDLQKTKPHFAQAPGKKFLVVKDLTGALTDQETDYYATVDVRSGPHGTLVEYWGMDLELGSQLRKLYCLKDQQIQLEENFDWAFFEGEGPKGPIKAHWLGYEQRWKRQAARSYSPVLLRYVDIEGRTVQEPQDQDERPAASEVFPSAFIWEDLKLPSELLH
jgi:hypothetical protein